MADIAIRVALLACFFVLTFIATILMIRAKPRRKHKAMKWFYEITIISLALLLTVYSAWRINQGGIPILFSFLAIAGLYVAGIHVASNIVGRYN